MRNEETLPLLNNVWKWWLLSNRLWWVWRMLTHADACRRMLTYATSTCDLHRFGLGRETVLIIKGLDNQAQISVWLSNALIIKPKNPIIKSINTQKKAWYVALENTAIYDCRLRALGNNTTREGRAVISDFTLTKKNEIVLTPEKRKDRSFFFSSRVL